MISTLSCCSQNHLFPLPLTTQSQIFLNNINSPLQLKQLHAHFIKTNNYYSNTTLPHISIWNSRLRQLSETENSGINKNAILLFYQMRLFDVLPDEFTLSFVLKACLRLKDGVNGRVIHGVVLKFGFGENLFLSNMIMNLYGLCCDMVGCLKVFDKMPQRDVVSWNIVMTHLVKCGDVDGAYGVFVRMPVKNVRSWTVMISGYVQCGRPEKGIELFMEMERVGVRPNEVTVVCVLAACADLGALDLGKRVHEFVDKCGLRKNLHICSTLIDMYVKCGCLENAVRVFDEMEEHTVVSWSAMISGLAMHGKGEEALWLFSRLIEAGLKPNGVTFVGLLHACSHMGLVDDGRRYFTSMSEDYGVVSKIEHYGCMVDLLSRAGRLQEAYNFIADMPIKANGVVWGALLGGCKVHGNIELAEEAIEHLTELDPLNDGYYVVLSNIYAEAGRWEDVARVRKLMSARGVKKKSGWSSITIDGVVHEFVAGDETHPQAEEISHMWEKLLVKMKQRGYVPKTSVVLLDVEENEKEKFLYRHSEKLAVVFGLMNTPEGSPIRIMKNLRVCEDCHAALKLISAIVSREIIVRDRNRFHCFKEGCCSCRDYW